ncbi:hypothetical protein [Rubripirellula reticaptiva]|uniref:hypothetical protein n=1 Tax=Rubripirellula reticaptiva TaxID=2528013 RepID=UPI0016493D4C|nr:hypothetical protein [Rubripirellula reticaptiva]
MMIAIACTSLTLIADEPDTQKPADTSVSEAAELVGEEPLNLPDTNAPKSDDSGLDASDSKMQEMQKSDTDETEPDAPATVDDSLAVDLPRLAFPRSLPDGRPIYPIGIYQSQMAELIPETYRPVSIEKLRAAIDRVSEQSSDVQDCRLRGSEYWIKLQGDKLVSDRSFLDLESSRNILVRRSLGRVNFALRQPMVRGTTPSDSLPRLESGSDGSLVAVFQGGTPHRARIEFQWQLFGRPYSTGHEFALRMPRTPQTRIVFSAPPNIHVEVLDGVLRSRPGPPNDAADASTDRDARWYEIEAGGLDSVTIRTTKERSPIADSALIVRRSLIQYDIDQGGLRWIQRMSVQIPVDRPFPVLSVSDATVTSIKVNASEVSFSTQPIDDRTNRVRIDVPSDAINAQLTSTTVMITGQSAWDVWCHLPIASWVDESAGESNGSSIIYGSAMDEVQIAVAPPLEIVDWELPPMWVQGKPRSIDGIRIRDASGPPLRSLVPVGAQAANGPAIKSQSTTSPLPDADQVSPWSKVRFAQRPRVGGTNTWLRTEVSKGTVTAKARISILVDADRLEPIRLRIQDGFNIDSLVFANSDRVIESPNSRSATDTIVLWPEWEDTQASRLADAVEDSGSNPLDRSVDNGEAGLADADNASQPGAGAPRIDVVNSMARSREIVIDITGTRVIPATGPIVVVPHCWFARVDSVHSQLFASIVPPPELNWSGEAALKRDRIRETDLSSDQLAFLSGGDRPTLYFAPELGRTPEVLLETPNVTFNVSTVLRIAREGDELAEQLVIDIESAGQRLTELQVQTGPPDSRPTYQWSLSGDDGVQSTSLPASDVSIDTSESDAGGEGGTYTIDVSDLNLRGRSLIARRRYTPAGDINLELPSVPGAASQRSEVRVGRGLVVKEKSPSVQLVPLVDRSEPTAAKDRIVSGGDRASSLKAVIDGATDGSAKEAAKNSPTLDRFVIHQRLRYDAVEQPSIVVAKADDDGAVTIVWRESVRMTASSRGTDDIEAIYQVSPTTPFIIRYSPELQLMSVTRDGEPVDVLSVPRRRIVLEPRGRSEVVRVVWNRSQFGKGWFRRCKMPQIDVSGVVMRREFELVPAPDTFSPATLFRDHWQSSSVDAIELLPGETVLLVRRNIALALGWLVALLTFAIGWSVASRSPLVATMMVAVLTAMTLLWWTWKLAVIGWLIVPVVTAAMLATVRSWKGHTSRHDDDNTRSIGTLHRRSADGSRELSWAAIVRILLLAIFLSGAMQLVASAQDAPRGVHSAAFPSETVVSPSNSSSDGQTRSVAVLVPVDSTGRIGGDVVYLPRSVNEWLFRKEVPDQIVQPYFQSADYQIRVRATRPGGEVVDASNSNSGVLPSSLAPSSLAPSSLAPSSLAPSSLAPSSLAPLGTSTIIPRAVSASTSGAIESDSFDARDERPSSVGDAATGSGAIGRVGDGRSEPGRSDVGTAMDVRSPNLYGPETSVEAEYVIHLADNRRSSNHVRLPIPFASVRRVEWVDDVDRIVRSIADAKGQLIVLLPKGEVFRLRVTMVPDLKQSSPWNKLFLPVPPIAASTLAFESEQSIDAVRIGGPQGRMMPETDLRRWTTELGPVDALNIEYRNSVATSGVGTQPLRRRYWINAGKTQTVIECEIDPPTAIAAGETFQFVIRDAEIPWVTSANWQLAGTELYSPTRRLMTMSAVKDSPGPIRLLWSRTRTTQTAAINAANANGGRISAGSSGLPDARVRDDSLVATADRNGIRTGPASEILPDGEPEYSVVIPEVIAAALGENAPAWIAFHCDLSMRLVPFDRGLTEPLSVDQFMAAWPGYRGLIDRAVVALGSLPIPRFQDNRDAMTTATQQHRLHVLPDRLELQFEATFVPDDESTTGRWLSVPQSMQLIQLSVDNVPIEPARTRSNGNYDYVLGDFTSNEPVVIRATTVQPLPRDLKFTPPRLQLSGRMQVSDTYTISRDDSTQLRMIQPVRWDSIAAKPLASSDSLARGWIPFATYNATIDSSSVSLGELGGVFQVKSQKTRFDCRQLITLTRDEGRWKTQTQIKFAGNRFPEFIDVEVPTRWCESFDVSPTTSWSRQPATDPAQQIIRIRCDSNELKKQTLTVSGQLQSSDAGRVGVPSVRVLGFGQRRVHISVPDRLTNEAIQWRTSAVEAVTLPDVWADAIESTSQRSTYLAASRAWSMDLAPLPTIDTDAVALTQDNQAFVQSDGVLMVAHWDLFPAGLESIQVDLPIGAKCLGGWSAGQSVVVQSDDSPAKLEDTSADTSAETVAETVAVPSAASASNNKPPEPSRTDAIGPQNRVRLPLSISRMSQSVELLIQVPSDVAKKGGYVPRLVDVPVTQNWLSVYQPSDRHLHSSTTRVDGPTAIDLARQRRAVALAHSTVESVEYGVDTIAERPTEEIAAWLAPWSARYARLARIAGHKPSFENGDRANPANDLTLIGSESRSQPSGDGASSLPGTPLQQVARLASVTSPNLVTQWELLDQRMADYVNRYMTDDTPAAKLTFDVSELDGFYASDVMSLSSANQPPSLQSVSTIDRGLRNLIMNLLTLALVTGLLVCLRPIRRFIMPVVVHPAFWLALMGVFGLFVAPVSVAIALLFVAIVVPAFPKSA